MSMSKLAESHFGFISRTKRNETLPPKELAGNFFSFKETGNNSYIFFFFFFSCSFKIFRAQKYILFNSLGCMTNS